MTEQPKLRAAAEEAARHGLTASGVPDVEAALATAAQRYPRRDPRDQSIAIHGDRWAETAGNLPRTLAGAGAITRRDLFELADQVRAGKASVLALFDATYAFGWGKKPLGLTRYREIVQATTLQSLEEQLRRAWGLLGTGNVFDAYSWLYGGSIPRQRVPPGAEGAGRVRNWGPAFFTKFLYVAAPQDGPTALILDEKLAVRVNALSGIEHLVTASGGVEAWTPYRYSVYCAWMEQTATRFEVAPDWLELALFNYPAPR